MQEAKKLIAIKNQNKLTLQKLEVRKKLRRMSLEDGTVRAIQGKEVRRPEVQGWYDSVSSDVAPMNVSTT